MLIQLISSDVWLNVLGWLRGHRKKVAQLAHQLGNRQFSTAAQHWLHISTKNVHLNELYFHQANRVELCVKEKDHGHWIWKGLPIADVPMPDNIRTFAGIRIQLFDTAVLDLCRRMQTLFQNVHLFMDRTFVSSRELDATKTVLHHLMPMFNGIETIRMDMRNALHILPFIRHRFPAQFYGATCLQLKTDMSSPTYNLSGKTVELVSQWLFTKQEMEGEPRILILTLRYCNCSFATSRLVTSIQKHFRHSTTAAVNFFVYIFHDAADLLLSRIQDSIASNAKTGEQLVIREWGFFLCVGRCPSGVDADEWIRAMETKAWRIWDPKNVISLYSMSVGPDLDVAKQNRPLAWLPDKEQTVRIKKG